LGLVDVLTGVLVINAGLLGVPDMTFEKVLGERRELVDGKEGRIRPGELLLDFAPELCGVLGRLAGLTGFPP